MPLINAQFALAYFPIPKVASTSIKHVFYQLETGQTFVPHANGQGDIHRLYRSRIIARRDYAKAAGLWKFAVFRDPVRRVISAYSNRVMFHSGLEKRVYASAKARLLRVSLRPDLNEFCLKLDRYRLLSGSLRHHTRPYCEFVGHDLAWLDDVFAIERLADLARALSERTGQSIKFPHLQTGGTKHDATALSPAALQALNRFTAADYRLLNGLYQPFTGGLS